MDAEELKKPFFFGGRESRQHPPTSSIMIFKCQYIFNWFICPPPSPPTAAFGNQGSVNRFYCNWYEKENWRTL